MGGIYRATISNWKNQDLQQQVFTSDIYQKWRKRKWKLLPAAAGIFWWYSPGRTNHLYIICTKIKNFKAILQDFLGIIWFFFVKSPKKF